MPKSNAHLLIIIGKGYPKCLLFVNSFTMEGIIDHPYYESRTEQFRYVRNYAIILCWIPPKIQSLWINFLNVG